MYLNIKGHRLSFPNILCSQMFNVGPETKDTLIYSAEK